MLPTVALEPSPGRRAVLCPVSEQPPPLQWAGLLALTGLPAKHALRGPGRKTCAFFWRLSASQKCPDGH